MKIVVKLTVGFLIVALLVLVVGYFSSNISQRLLEETIGNNAIALGRDILDKIDRSIYARIEGVQVYSKDLASGSLLIESNAEFENLDNVEAYIDEKDREWVSAPKETETAFMRSLIDNELSRQIREEFELKKFYKEKYGYFVFEEIFVTNKYGANAAQTQRTSDYYQADEEWWKKAKEEGIFVDNISYDESAEVYSVDICIRIDDKDGNFLGVIKAVLNIEDVFSIIRELKSELDSKDEKTSHFKLFTKDRRLMYSTKPKFRFLEDLSGMEILKQDYKSEQEYIISEGDEPDEKEKLFAHAHSRGSKAYKGLDWGLIVEYDTEEILIPVFNLRKDLLIGSFVVTLFALLIGGLISHSILKPIRKLMQATVKIGRGDLDTKVDIKSIDEIGALASSFNKMTEDLQSTMTSVGRLNKEIVERKRAEEQLIQAEKMAALGTLSAGMAHEMNNPLMGTMLLTETLLSEKKKGTKEYKTLSQIVDGLKRISNVVLKLLVFSRKEKIILKTEDVNAIVEATIPLIAHEYKSKQIKLVKELGENLPNVQIAKNSIQQVLVNILLNAKDAVLDSKSKKVTISTYLENDMVNIKIKDEGCGIKKEHIKNIFDPFFTTKPAGKGLGMGMPIVRNIIDQNNGKINIASEENKGTEVMVSLSIAT